MQARTQLQVQPRAPGANVFDKRSASLPRRTAREDFVKVVDMIFSLGKKRKPRLNKQFKKTTARFYLSQDYPTKRIPPGLLDRLGSRAQD